MKEQKLPHVLEMTYNSNVVKTIELDMLVSESNKVILGMFNTRDFKKIKVTLNK